MIGSLLSAMSILTGTAIYLLLGNERLPICSWAAEIGLFKALLPVRIQLAKLPLPEWFLYSLPDALWMFALCTLTLSIWNFKLDRESFIWIISVITLGMGYELLQMTHLIGGTFDPIDLLLMFIAALIPLLFTFKTLLNETEN